MSERVGSCGEVPDEMAEILARLRPTASAVSRDRLMFLAGRQDALRGRTGSSPRQWQLATAASWLMTASLVVFWTLAPDRAGVTPFVQKAPSHDNVNEIKLESPSPPDHAQSVVSAVKARSSPRSSQGRESPNAWGTLGNGNKLPRLSLVGWEGLQLASRDRTNGDVSLDIVDSPPATYSQLMKLYRDQQTNSGFEGDLL